jgi:hypothetical protein
MRTMHQLDNCCGARITLNQVSGKMEWITEKRPGWPLEL